MKTFFSLIRAGTQCEQGMESYDQRQFQTAMDLLIVTLCNLFLPQPGMLLERERDFSQDLNTDIMVLATAADQPLKTGANL